jgi:hypothetical protein
MADRPILFSAPMILALLDGRKTQTRRILNPQPYSPESVVSYDKRSGSWMSCEPSPATGGTRQMDPWRPIRIKIGDRLYVREAWRTAPEFDAMPPRDIPKGSPRTTMADTGLTFPNPLWGKLRQSMFMPRWVSRLTLIVTDVRVERLNSIPREDAIAEGLIKHDWLKGTLAAEMNCDWGFDGDTRHGSAVSAYSGLWEHINGPGSWANNPWVVVYTFRVVMGNIDQIARAAA